LERARKPLTKDAEERGVGSIRNITKDSDAKPNVGRKKVNTLSNANAKKEKLEKLNNGCSERGDP